MSNIYHKITCDIFSDLRSGALKISCDGAQRISLLPIQGCVHIVRSGQHSCRTQIIKNVKRAA